MTMQHARVAVVVPVRDEAATIDLLLDALAAQTRRPDEVVIVDAGSTDGTVALIAARVAAMPFRVRVIEAGPSFPGRARNLGVAATDADVIVFLDAGNRIVADGIERLVQPFSKDESVDVVYGNYHPVLETRFERAAAVAWVSEHPRDRAIRGEVVACLALRRRAWAKGLAFREDLRAAEDIVFKDELRRRQVRAVDAPRAVISWGLPRTPPAAFHKVLAYSRWTLEADLGSRWHRAVVRMYGVLLASIAAAWMTSRSVWAVVILATVFYAVRAIVSLVRKPEFVGGGIDRAIVVVLSPLVILLVDAAMFAGFGQWLLRRGHLSPEQLAVSPK